MKYQITHITRYRYQQLVNSGHNRGTLKPRELPEQKLLEYQINILPETSELTEQVDYFGNHTIHFFIPYQHSELSVTTRALVEKETTPLVEAPKITYREAKKGLANLGGDLADTVQYQLESPYIPLESEAIKAYAKQFFAEDKPVFESCLELNHRIFEDFEFVPGATTISTPVSQVFSEKKGVCQDFAHLAIAALRFVGLPVRYVSGYIETLPPEGEEKLVGVDATHAWISVYLPGFGWMDFDPTNDQIPSMQHITIGWGRDYGDVVPLKGVVFSSGISQLSVSVDIQRIHNASGTSP